jgi:hypothetical protein
VADVWDSSTATWDSLVAVWDSAPVGAPSIWDSAGGTSATPSVSLDLLGLNLMNAGTTIFQSASNVSAASGNFCQIGGAGTLTNPSAVLIVGYKAVVGSGVSAGTLTLQTLDGDGTWRAIATALQPISGTLGANTIYQGNLLLGPVRGVRWALAGLAGGSITVLDLMATMQ